MKTKQERNKPLRLATILMVIVMITSIAICGTLAKYTAAATGASQFARVGAFRVLVNGYDISYWDASTTAKTLNFNLGDVLYDNSPTVAYSTLNNKYNAGPPLVFDDWKNLAGNSNAAANVQGTGAVGADATKGFLLVPGEGGMTKLSVKNLSEVPVNIAFGAKNASGTAAKATADLDHLKMAITNINTWTSLEAFEAAGGFEMTAAPAGPVTYQGTLSDLVGDTAVNVTLAAGDTTGQDIYLFWKWDYEVGATDPAKAAYNKWDTDLGAGAASWLYNQLPSEIDPNATVPVLANQTPRTADVASAIDIQTNYAAAVADATAKGAVAGFFLDEFVLTATQVD